MLIGLSESSQGSMLTLLCLIWLTSSGYCGKRSVSSRCSFWHLTYIFARQTQKTKWGSRWVPVQRAQLGAKGLEMNLFLRIFDSYDNREVIACSVLGNCSPPLATVCYADVVTDLMTAAITSCYAKYCWKDRQASWKENHTSKRSKYMWLHPRPLWYLFTFFSFRCGNRMVEAKELCQCSKPCFLMTGL